MMNRKLITEAPVVGPAELPRTIVRTASALLVKYNIVGVFILMVIVSSIVSDVFLTPQNISNLLVQVSGASIASLGMLLVILTGGIDLSVGSVFALSSVVLALSTLRFPLALALLIAILVSCASGSLVGYLVAGRGMAPFMATLAFMTIDRGMAFILSKGSPISLPESASALNNVFGTESLLGVPYPVFLMFVVFVYVLFTLRFGCFRPTDRRDRQQRNRSTAFGNPGAPLQVPRVCAFCRSFGARWRHQHRADRCGFTGCWGGSRVGRNRGRRDRRRQSHGRKGHRPEHPPRRTYPRDDRKRL